MSFFLKDGGETAGPMSYVLRDSVTITRPFSVLSIQGTSDPIVPFNGTPDINYSLASPFHVELKIYNTLGREIRTLVNSMQPVGSREVSWDGRDNSGDVVASGVYFYQLKAGSFVKTRKMLFIR